MLYLLTVLSVVWEKKNHGNGFSVERYDFESQLYHWELGSGTLLPYASV